MITGHRTPNKEKGSDRGCLAKEEEDIWVGEVQDPQLTGRGKGHQVTTSHIGLSKRSNTYDLKDLENRKRVPDGVSKK